MDREERLVFVRRLPTNCSLLRAVFLMPFCFDTVVCKHLAYSNVALLSLFAEYPTALPSITDEAVDRARLCLTSVAEPRIISK